MRFLFIGLFGVIGVFARYGLDSLALKLPTTIPVGTLIINVLGSFAAGAVYAAGVERSYLPPDIRIGILVGLLGGFTTFSAYALQSTRLIESGAPVQGLAYLFGSPILGLAAAFAGLALVRSFSA